MTIKAFQTSNFSNGACDIPIYRGPSNFKHFKWSLRHPDLSGLFKPQTLQMELATSRSIGALQTSNFSNTEHGTRKTERSSRLLPVKLIQPGRPVRNTFFKFIQHDKIWHLCNFLLKIPDIRPFLMNYIIQGTKLRNGKFTW